MVHCVDGVPDSDSESKRMKNGPQLYHHWLAMGLARVFNVIANADGLDSDRLKVDRHCPTGREKNEIPRADMVSHNIWPPEKMHRIVMPLDRGSERTESNNIYSYVDK